MPGNYREYGLKGPEDALPMLQDIQSKEDWQDYLTVHLIEKKNDRWNIFHLLTAVTGEIQKRNPYGSLSTIDKQLLKEIVRLNLLYKGNCESNRTGRYAVERLGGLKSVESLPVGPPVLIGSESEPLYIPTCQDYGNIRRKLLREGRKKVAVNEILDIMKNDLEEQGHKMAKNWRTVTSENIRIWSGARTGSR